MLKQRLYKNLEDLINASIEYYTTHCNINNGEVSFLEKDNVIYISNNCSMFKVEYNEVAGMLAVKSFS